jgi:hypothetical protein
MKQFGENQYRPAILSHDEECRELHRIMTSKTENTGSRGRLAFLTGLSESTIRDYLIGRIKHSASFVAACFIATNGDPEIAQFLTPANYALMPVPERKNPLANIEMVLGDVHILAGLLHADVRCALNDGHFDSTELNSLKRRIYSSIEALFDVERYLEEIYESGGQPPQT